MVKRLSLIGFIGLLFLTSCSSGPKEIDWGKNACEFCKMTLMDHRFGAQIINKHGKSYIFDDIICLSGFIHAATLSSESIKCIYLIDFNGSGFIRADESVIIKSESIRSPMSSHLASVRAKNDFTTSPGDNILKFEDLFPGMELKCQ